MATRDELAHEVRRSLYDSLGSAFAAKASDELCLLLAPAAGLAAAPESAAGLPAAAQPVIIEMEHEALAEEAKSRLTSLESALAGQLDTALPEAMPEPERARLGAHLRQALRTSTGQEMRRRFDERSRAIRERLEVHASAGVDLEGETPEQARPFVQLCWLNATASTATFTPALAEVAESDEVRALDLPRRLVREVDETGPLIGGTAFRERFGVGGSGVVVAVIDSEIDPAHPGYEGRVEHKRNFTGEPWGAPGKHGMGVAGIIHSVAPQAALWNYKVFAQKWWLDSNDFGGALAIQQALEDGAQVANCSWGAGPAGDGTSREARACDVAWSLGLILVKSAGNTGPNGSTLTTPADAEGVIVVGATDRSGRSLGDYSSRGPTRNDRARPHLLAPGGLPGAAGLGIRSTLPNNRFGEAEDGTSWGTSFAAPHVTGAIALLLEHRGDLAPDAVREQLIACCAKLPDLGANDQGAGLLDLGLFTPA